MTGDRARKTASRFMFTSLDEILTAFSIAQRGPHCDEAEYSDNEKKITTSNGSIALGFINILQVVFVVP